MSSVSRPLRLSLCTEGAEQTRELGRQLGLAARAGDVIALVGSLGTGKTCLTQGIARGLGVEEDTLVCSPTFGIIHEYPGRLPLVHLDFYRLEAAELEELGLEEYLEEQGVCVMEWAERWPAALEFAHLVIRISGEAERRTFHLSTTESRFFSSL